MSNKQPKEINELAQVLNRINTLVKSGDIQPADLAEDIPQLTEIYEGELLPFVAKSASELPVLNEIVKGSVTDAEAALEEILSQAEKMEALLAELTPLVQAVLKKAVEQKLINAEKPMCKKMEAEIMQALRERLQAFTLNNKL